MAYVDCWYYNADQFGFDMLYLEKIFCHVIKIDLSMADL